MKKLIVVLLFSLLIAAAPDGKTLDPPGFLLNLYHFNIQYVVGHEGSMRRIITESFDPLVEFYIRHPEYGADFEMQGEMIQYMADNFPETLDRFRKIVNSGQVNLVSFHYSDSLLLAFPGHDQRWSVRLNDELFERNNIRRSPVIFAQEAQFGEGYARIAKDFGYDVAVITSGHYGWFQDNDQFPYFTVNGLDVIGGGGGTEPSSGIKVKWQFLGDGELVVTGGFSPYFVGLFRENKARIKLLEEQFQAAVKEGYRPAKITDYIQALRDAGVKPSPLKPVLDSPWRPGDGSGVFQWMGRYSLPWEKDYDMRTENWKVRSILIEAERAGASEATLKKAWGHMLNAEVSDPTGWYPLPVEVKWDYAEMDKTIAALKSDPAIDFEAVKRKAAEAPVCGAAVGEGPLPVRLWGTAEGAEVKWSTLDETENGFCLDVVWKKKGDGGFALPFGGDSIQYSPAFMEDEVREIALSDIKPMVIHLGLTNGLIGLGGGNWLVRDNQKGIVGARVDIPAREIGFEIDRGREKYYAFRLYLLTGTSADEALAFANRVNRVTP